MKVEYVVNAERRQARNPPDPTAAARAPPSDEAPWSQGALDFMVASKAEDVQNSV